METKIGKKYSFERAKYYLTDESRRLIVGGLSFSAALDSWNRLIPYRLDISIVFVTCLITAAIVAGIARWAFTIPILEARDET